MKLILAWLGTWTTYYFEKVLYKQAKKVVHSFLSPIICNTFPWLYTFLPESSLLRWNHLKHSSNFVIHFFTSHIPLGTKLSETGTQAKDIFRILRKIYKILLFVPFRRSWPLPLQVWGVIGGKSSPGKNKSFNLLLPLWVCWNML